MKILVIDDSMVMRKMVIKALTESQFANSIFAEAADGVDGLAKASLSAFDVALVDWNMPKMNGLECAIAMRKRCPRMTIVMVTTETGMTKVQEAKRQDIDGYVGKPFDNKSLPTKLAKAIEDAKWRR